MENKPILKSAKFKFSQPGNCLDDSDSYESLKIEVSSDLGIDKVGDCFYVLKTEKWSIDNVGELQELLDRINKITK